jgi:hypothetical protein
LNILSKRTGQTVFHTALPTAVKLSRMHGKQIPGSFGCAWNFFILAFCKKEKSMTNSELID